MLDLGIAGKTAIITGGSRGIGRASAMALAEQGVNVCLTARRQNLLDETADEIRKATGVKVLTVSADMTSSEDVKGMVAKAVSEFGGVDILVNNAASFQYGNALELGLEHWIEHFEVKAFGYLRCMFEVYPHMQKGRWGRIINVAGQAARMGGGPSGANNAAIINMTKAFANELAKDRITVNALHPGGPSDSDREPARIEWQAQQQGISVDEAAARAARNIPPGGRRVVSADPANLVVFLASQQAEMVTGETWAINAANGDFDRRVIY